MTCILNIFYFVIGHTVKKTWMDTEVKSSKQAFLEGLTTGLKAPTGKGQRLIISHIGSEEGFVEGGLLMFESKKNTEDYHHEMNADCFEEWFQEIVPKLKPNSVLVMDNAPYHSRKVERIPTTAWKKADIQEWLRTKCIAFDDSMIKAELLNIVKANKGEFNKYAVDELAALYGVTVLRLPPYHCELNPIELVWAQVKGYVARNNTTFKLVDLKRLLHEGLREVTPQKWADCITHTIKVEDEMFKLSHLIDNVCDRFIINITETDSESDDDSSCSDISM